MKDQYTAQDITVLEGLEAVRKRPGMYIGSTGPRGLHHLVYEVVDNSVDEALAGHCKNIEITISKDNMVTVVDDGRGIPVDPMEKQAAPAVEVVLTVLHAGGKFGGDGYKVSGGLHGVGISVVNALSEKLTVQVHRDGQIHEQTFARGKKTTELKIVGKTRKTGTTIQFLADSTVFETIEYDLDVLCSRLREMAFLTRGLRIHITDERKEPIEEHEFQYSGGIVDFVKHLMGSREPVLKRTIYFSETKDDAEVEVAIQYNSGYTESVFTFANNINTHEGGSHLIGFKNALTRTLNEYARKKNILKEKDDNLLGEDIREGIVAIISVKLREPQFEGQTKTKLGNPEVQGMVQGAVASKLGEYLEENPSDGKAMTAKAMEAAFARIKARQARDLARRKGFLDSTSLPGKLADCSSRNPEECEIYIVEGDSAGGTAKQARDRNFQAILPLRGKILNVEKARMDKVLQNEEIQNLIAAMGTGIAGEFDLEGARYHKIIIMTDADVDGSHIRTLILTFLFRHMKQLIEAGYVYIAQPPLFKIAYERKVDYAYTERELEEKLKSISGKPNLQRYKGLGEMNAEQLWETTMDPAERTLLRVGLEDEVLADSIISICMGDEVEPRKNFIQKYAREVKFLDV